MKKLLKQAGLLLVLLNLWSCDTFKNDNVTPAPNAEVVNESVLRTVKLYYPNATEIKIKEIVPNRVWEVRLFNGNQEIILNIDDNNRIFSFSSNSRTNSEVLDLPDKAISYIKSNYHPNVSIQRATLRLDENGNRLLYVVGISAHDGNPQNGTTLYFDMVANIASMPTQQVNELGNFKGQSWLLTFEGVPDKIKDFIRKHQLNRYTFSNEGWSKQGSNIEGSYSVLRNIYTNGLMYVVAVYHPIERISPAFTGPGERALDYIGFKEDGTFIEWNSWPLNSTRGNKTENVNDAQMTTQMTQTLNQMFGQNNWKIDIGLDYYIWFTRSSRFLQIEEKSKPGVYYDFFLGPDGNITFTSGSASQYKLIKNNSDVPESVQTTLNQQFNNWKVVFGRNTLGYKKVPTGEVTPIGRMSLDMRIEANGKLYDVSNGTGSLIVTARNF